MSPSRRCPRDTADVMMPQRNSDSGPSTAKSSQRTIERGQLVLGQRFGQCGIELVCKPSAGLLDPSCQLRDLVLNGMLDGQFDSWRRGFDGGQAITRGNGT